MQIPADPRAVHRPCASRGDQREPSRIVPAVSTELLHRMEELLIQELQNPGSRVGGGDAKRLRNPRGDRIASAIYTESSLVTEDIGAEPAQHQLSVGNRRLLSAPAVAYRSRIGTRTTRADEQHTPPVDICDRPSAGTDTMNVDAWERNVEAAELELGSGLGLPLANQGDVAACAADLHREKTA